MNLVDSHSHLFLDDFSEDLPMVINRAKAAGISHIFMPNIDSTTITRMLRVATLYKDYCYPMVGLHPTSVNASYNDELTVVTEQLNSLHTYVAIGEIGIDLYRDTTYLREQSIAFERQIQLALAYQLPVIIHCRDAFEQMHEILSSYKDTPLKGIFHSFTGTAEEAKKLLEFTTFMIGINGVVTFKNSSLPIVLESIPLSRIALETDSPYLTPVPNRGRRNESAFLKDVLMRVAEIFRISPETAARITSENVLNLFEMSN
ncbi:D-aminoacyl-tRNA deacylase [termite gut metagenome]|uniref:D-aminoacyl-tRNA deacylase n=1 Tax=termite gut metagenome TaxID=433724 RepID=A0A5J4RM07_9ZZZZ